jgi:hypothetical protein
MVRLLVDNQPETRHKSVLYLMNKMFQVKIFKFCNAVRVALEGNDARINRKMVKSFKDFIFSKIWFFLFFLIFPL